MKVILDTNVVVSGTFWAGSSFKILNLIDQEKLIFIVSREILEEYDKIIYSEEILEKTSIYQQAKIQVLEKILSKAIIIDPKEKIKAVKEDPEDDKFIECGVSAKANYIISNDKHLLKLKEFNGIKIIKPEEFLLKYQSNFQG